MAALLWGWRRRAIACRPWAASSTPMKQGGWAAPGGIGAWVCAGSYSTSAAKSLLGGVAASQTDAAAQVVIANTP